MLFNFHKWVMSLLKIDKNKKKETIKMENIQKNVKVLMISRFFMNSIKNGTSSIKNGTYPTSIL